MREVRISNPAFRAQVVRLHLQESMNLRRISEILDTDYCVVREALKREGIVTRKDIRRKVRREEEPFMRFLARTKLSATGCLEWTGGRNKNGYGLILVRRFRTRLAHRISFQLVHGDIPDEQLVLHRCNNSICVNVSHLYAGTNADNMRDRELAGRNGMKRPEVVAKMLATKEGRK